MADAFCTKCGTPGSGAFCADCGQPRDAALLSPAAPPAAPTTARRHSLPALLSFFIPSLGQFVKGDFVSGLLVIAAFCALLVFAMIAAPLAPLGGLVIWIWQIYDAYTAPDGATKRELKRLAQR